MSRKLGETKDNMASHSDVGVDGARQDLEGSKDFSHEPRPLMPYLPQRIEGIKLSNSSAREALDVLYTV